MTNIDIQLIQLIDETIQKFLNVPPGAEALVLLNPRHLPSYISGTILSQDLSKSTDVISKPFHNLQVAKNYVATGHNASHTFKRGLDVFVDTAKINLLCESAEVVGPTLAGQHASECA